jgi:hypothetical protein
MGHVGGYGLNRNARNSPLILASAKVGFPPEAVGGALHPPDPNGGHWRLTARALNH